MTKIYQGKNASKIYYYLISKFGYNTIQQGTFIEANNIRWVKHTDRLYLLKPELLDAVKSAVKFAKSLRTVLFDYYAEKEAYTESLYEDGDYNLGDDDCDIADDIANDNTNGSNKLIKWAQQDFKELNLNLVEIDNSIYTNTKLTADQIDELKDYFAEMWRM